MIAAALLMSVLSSNDGLAAVTVDTMKLKAPVKWKTVTSEDGSKSWTSEDERGAVSFYAGPLEKARPPKACVDALVEAVGADGFTRLTVGLQPAAKKITKDYVGGADAEKNDENQVMTTTVVGCNGTTKWVLTFTARTADGTRFGPILKRVLESISYGKRK